MTTAKPIHSSISQNQFAQSQISQEKTITLTMEEMKAMEKDNWKPSQKIIDFIKMKN